MHNVEIIILNLFLATLKCRRQHQKIISYNQNTIIETQQKLSMHTEVDISHPHNP